MSLSSLSIVHIVAPDIDVVRADVLGVLLDRLPARHRLVLIGTPPLTPPPGVPWKRLPTWSHMPIPALARAQLAGDSSQVIVHAWSGKALTFAQTQCTDEPGCLLMAEGRAAFESPVLTPEEFDDPQVARWVARSAREAARLGGKNCAAERIVVIRNGVDFATLDAARRPDARRALDLESGDVAVLILPPVTRATGGDAAAWGALLAQRVDERIRLIVPGEGGEVDRSARFVDSSQRRAMLRLTGDRMRLSELLVACDVAMYLPAGEAGVDSLAWAMAAGRPIVASAVPSVTELLAHGSNAWLCRPNDAKDAARRLLEIIEDGEANRERVEAARRQAYAVFSRQRMIEQYAAVYENLAAGRAAGAGIEDAAARA